MLEQILARTKEKLQLRMSIVPRSEMERRARAAPPPRDFLAAIRRVPPQPLRLVAELRRGSPLRRVLRTDLDAARFATACEGGGAAAIAVCTEEDHFQGSQQDLITVRNVVSLPVLHRDYVLDPYQLLESRAFGADAVTLNGSLLDRAKLRDFLTFLKDLGMTGVVEVGEERELGTCLAVGSQCLRIDNRDPRTLRPVSGKAERLRLLIPPDITILVEGEQGTPAEAGVWSQQGADALLLSEPLVLAPDPATKIRGLFPKS